MIDLIVVALAVQAWALRMELLAQQVCLDLASVVRQR